MRLGLSRICNTGCILILSVATRAAKTKEFATHSHVILRFACTVYVYEKQLKSAVISKRQRLHLVATLGLAMLH